MIGAFQKITVPLKPRYGRPLLCILKPYVVFHDSRLHANTDSWSDTMVYQSTQIHFFIKWNHSKCPYGVQHLILFRKRQERDTEIRIQDHNENTLICERLTTIIGIRLHQERMKVSLFQYRYEDLSKSRNGNKKGLSLLVS